MITRWRRLLTEAGWKRWKVLLFHATEVRGHWVGAQEPSFDTEERLWARVRVFEDFHEGGRKYTGEASLEVEASLADEEIRARLQSLAHETRRDPWPWYPMHQQKRHPGWTVESSLAKKPTLQSWLEPLAELFFSASGPGPELEIALQRLETVYLDSAGRELDHVGMKLTLVASQERHRVRIQHSEYLPDRIMAKATRFAEEVQMLHHPARWSGSAPELVVLSGDVPGQLFHLLLRQLDARALYAGESALAIGCPLLPEEALETVHLRALGRLYNSPFTRWFDEDGVALEDVELVRDGRVLGFLAGERDSHLLGLPLTGHPVNLSVGPGSVRPEEVRVSPYLEIDRLEDLTFDPKAGSFRARVHLAVGSEGPGQPRRAYPALVLGGSLWELLAASRWSTVVAQRLNFEGPEFLVVPSRFVALAE